MKMVVGNKSDRKDNLLANWNFDLLVCESSAIGYESNIIYRADGGRGESTDFEDAAFNYKGLDCFLYGVFDGHNGARVAHFAQHKIASDLCFGQLSDIYTDEEVYKKLNETFENTSKEYMDSINQALMGKLTLEDAVEGLQPYLVQQEYPQLSEQLNEFKAEVSGGCSAAIALIHNTRLFVANVGDTRVVLCRAAGNNGELGVVQLSTDHTVSTISELQRLGNLGVDIEQLQTLSILRVTRSLGDWSLKADYKNNYFLSAASEEPILSIPSIHGGEEIDNSMKFLILMSHGVYHAYMHATDALPEEVNSCIASMVEEEIGKRSSIEDVAQEVINRICRMHLSKFLKSHNTHCLKRDDMTLIVKLFNMELGSTQNRSSSGCFEKRFASYNLPPLKIPSALEKSANTPSSTGSNTPSTATPGTPKGVTVGPFSNNDQSSSSPPTTALGFCSTELISTNQTMKTFDKPPDMTMFITDNFKPSPLFDENTSLLVVSKTKSYSNDNLSLDNLMDNSTKTYSSSLSCKDPSDKIYNRVESIELDENGRCQPYVDFSEFIKNVERDGGEKVLFPELFL
ncbi:TGF-beta-activated kinase 1 and MAP3K7-binding protein 1 isoform X3 [Hydra vulgaris]|uniref:TGF-beta-activated kinase 1 and MAP3K7-binding protein 1 isoform X3 n=1 Tax=Hydra vulgaris TaxID=6087 RepID=A0ABM4C200_HYDVU